MTTSYLCLYSKIALQPISYTAKMFTEKNLVINMSKAKMLMGKILDIVSSTRLEISKFFSPPVFVLTLPSGQNVLALVLQTATFSPVVGSELYSYCPPPQRVTSPSYPRTYVLPCKPSGFYPIVLLTIFIITSLFYDVSSCEHRPGIGPLLHHKCLADCGHLKNIS